MLYFLLYIVSIVVAYHAIIRYINDLFVFERKWFCILFNRNPNKIYMGIPSILTIIKLARLNKVGRNRYFFNCLKDLLSKLNSNQEYTTETHEKIIRRLQEKEEEKKIKITYGPQETKLKRNLTDIYMLKFPREKIQFYEVRFIKL